MKRMWIDPQLGPPTVRTYRYDWSSDRADGLEETELLFDSEGRLIGVDYHPERPSVNARKPGDP